jgi:polysaccharide chain length determinant protein (PEP-CTERM system associated)
MTSFVAAAYILPEKYEAQSTVFIENNIISNYVEGVAITPSLDERLRVLIYSMESRTLLLKVMKALDMDIDIPESQVEALINSLRKNTDIEIVKNPNSQSGGMDMFIVSFTDRDPEFAQNYVTTLVNLYIEENLLAKRKESHIVSTFLTEQITFFKNKLDDIDKDIIKVRTEEGLFVSMDEAKIIGQLEAGEQQIEELNIQKMELTSRRKLIQKNLEKENPYTVAILGSKGSIEERIVMLQKKMDQLLMNYTENYPEVIRTKAELTSLNERLRADSGEREIPNGQEDELSTINPVYQELKKDLSDTELELASLDIRKSYLEKQIERKKKYLREMPADKKKLADLEREKNSIKKIYEELTLRLGQSEVSNQMEIQDKGATFRIVDPAVLPASPVSPDKKKILLLGIFAGLAGAFGLILLIEKIDHSVRSVDMIKTLGVPVLGIIPRIQIPEEISRKRKKDITVYTCAGIYMVFILGVFVNELINKL